MSRVVGSELDWVFFGWFLIQEPTPLGMIGTEKGSKFEKGRVWNVDDQRNVGLHP